MPYYRVSRFLLEFTPGDEESVGLLCRVKLALRD